MKTIAMTGASGFVGTHLKRSFEAEGWDVVSIERSDISGSPQVLHEKLKRADAVVNLAGAPVIKRWTEGYKKTMYKSRVDLTRTLVNAISMMEQRPQVLVSASAVGFYSSEGEHDEYSFRQADDFLGKMAGDWEKEAERAVALGVRTVVFRFGIVLGRNGGALSQMIPPFRIGLGGTVGNGRQAFSWIHTEDLIRAFLMAINDTSMEGEYNLCAPNPSTNRELTRSLADALRRPAFLRVPGFVLSLQYGQGAEVLTKGQRVFPRRLLEAGFSFRFSSVEEAVRDCVT